MYRARFHVQVKYGHFKDYFTICEQLNELARSRGWAESTYWVPTVGMANELIGESDYPDLETFQQEGDAFSADPEAMALVRATSEHTVQGSAHSELLEAAPHLA